MRKRERQGWALRRYLFGSLAIASLILCLTTVVLWLRSYRLLDELSRVKVGTEAPTGVGNHATVYVRESVIGTTSGKIYWSVETSRRTYRPDDPSDDAILQDWKAREGVHFHYSAQPAVLLENQYPPPPVPSTRPPPPTAPAS